MAFYDYIVNQTQQENKPFIEKAKETLTNIKNVAVQYPSALQETIKNRTALPLPLRDLSQKLFPPIEEQVGQNMAVRGYGQFKPIGSELKPTTGQEQSYYQIQLMKN